MQERAHNNSASLATKVKIWIRLKDKNEKYPTPESGHVKYGWFGIQKPSSSYEEAYQLITSCNLPKETTSRLMELLHSPEENIATRLSILEEIFPEVKNWLSIRDGIGLANNSEDKITILKNGLENGFRLSPEDMDLLLTIRNWRQFPEMIKYYFDHDSCTTEHIMNLFNQCHFSNGNYYDLDCVFIQHEKFPNTREEYFQYRGEEISSITYREGEIALVMNNKPDLCESYDLIKMAGYCMSMYYDDDSNKTSLHKTLLLIFNHPEFPFLYSSAEYKLKILDFKFKNPLYWAAENKLYDIYNLFYFHEDTLDLARKHSFTFFKNTKNLNIISVINKNLLAHLEERMIIFSLGMKGLFPQEILLSFYELMVEAGTAECNSAMMNGKLPEYHSVLFQKNQVSHKEIIANAKLAIQDYLNDKPSEKGKTRSACILWILSNRRISSGFKLVAIYSILNEYTYKESRVKEYLNKKIGQHTNIIQTAAEQHADTLNLDLTRLCENLLYQIYKTYSTCCITLKTIDPDDLINQVSKGAETNKNRM
jgi:hypothetical protein